MDEDKVRKIRSENNQQLPGSTHELIGSQIISLMRSSDTRPTFRKKSNEEQFKFAT